MPPLIGAGNTLASVTLDPFTPLTLSYHSTGAGLMVDDPPCSKVYLHTVLRILEMWLKETFSPLQLRGRERLRKEVEDPEP